MRHWILILTLFTPTAVIVSIDFNDSKACDKAASEWLKAMEAKGVSHNSMSALCVKSHTKRF